MLLHLYAFTLLSAPPPPPPLPITFDTAHPLRTNVSEKYLGVNIDAASMAAGMDFSNPSLRNLLKAMGPIKLRIGGTSSHGLVFTNAPSPSSCGPAVCASSCCGAKTYRDEVSLGCFSQQPPLTLNEVDLPCPPFCFFIKTDV